MKLSICSANYGRNPLEKIIYRTAEMGFDGIEITVQYHALPTISSSERKAIVGWLKDSAIGCSAVHFIFDKSVRLSSDDPEDISHAKAYTKSVVDLAADLGTNAVVVGGGGNRSFKPGQDREKIRKIMVETFAECGEYAGQKGVFLGLEALNRYETNFINTLADSKQVAQQTGCPNVKVMADTYHMNIEETSLPDAIRGAGNDLLHLHLVDSNRLSPGEGHTDMREIVKTLKQIGYKGYCSFEVFYISPDLIHFETFEEADKHMVAGKRYMDELLASL
jgi:sugar phosphate isomerase/epimerase